MTITFRPGRRESVGLIIGIAGPSGSGKSFSSMRIAKGIAGEKAFAVIDSENGRALHYADLFAFDHATIKPPFSPATYIDAITSADDIGYPVIVVDQVSHEHAGEGGLLDMHEAELQRMAGDDWKRREAVKMAAWVRAKGEHKKFVNKLLQLRAHVILAFRAEQKIEMIRKDGKLEVVPKRIMSGFSDWIPIAEKNLLYELTASFLLVPDRPGIPLPVKLQEQHRSFFPLDSPITEQSGELIAAWARGGEVHPASAPSVGAEMPARSAPPSIRAERKRLIDEIRKEAEARKVSKDDLNAAWPIYCGKAMKETADPAALTDLLAWVKTRPVAA